MVKKHYFFLGEKRIIAFEIERKDSQAIVINDVNVKIWNKTRTILIDEFSGRIDENKVFALFDTTLPKYANDTNFFVDLVVDIGENDEIIINACEVEII